MPLSHRSLLSRTGPSIRRVALLTLCALVVALADVAVAQQPVLPTDLLRLRAVESIDVSRDGRTAIWTVRSSTPRQWVDDDTEYATRSHLWIADLFSEPLEPRQLTFGASIDTAPKLSPDGTRVAFVRSEPGASGGGQLYLLDLRGGDARSLTDGTTFERGVGSPAWAPDGRSIAFTSAVAISELPGTPSWPLERPGRAWNDEPHSGTADAPESADASPDGNLAQRRAWLAKQAAKDDPRVIVRLDFIDDRGLRGGMTFHQIFTIGTELDAATPRRLTAAFRDHHDPVFMPDGSRIVFRASGDQPNVHPDRSIGSELRSIRADGSDERRVAGRAGWSYVDPMPSRDGTAIAFRARPIDEPSFRQWMLGVIDATDDHPTGDATGGENVASSIMLTQRLDRSVRRFAWHGADGLIFSVADRGGFPLLSLQPANPELLELERSVDGMPVGVHAFAAGGGVIVLARTTPQHPCRLILRDARGERTLMDLNRWTAERWLAMPQERWITRPDGSRVQMWVMEPRRVRRAERHPLLLLIHGGPNAMWGPGELTMWHEMQVLAGAGFGIVYANPRGSGGYGYAFERANRQDWGPGPAGDVLAAVDAALSLDWVDRQRLGVSGGSYGGFLTAWILTRDNRFRAAIADRGVYDIDTFFGEGSAWRLVERAFGGNPYDARVRELLDRHRPILDARRIRTPLLIMHGDNDRRTGYAQSEMLFRALKSLERPVELVRYPRADHDMSRRGELRQRIDRIVRMTEFLDRHLSQ